MAAACSEAACPDLTGVTAVDTASTPAQCKPVPSQFLVLSVFLAGAELDNRTPTKTAVCSTGETDPHAAAVPAGPMALAGGTYGTVARVLPV